MYIILSMENLSEKQKIFFEKLKDHFQTNALSSYEKIKNIFGYKSKNSVKQYIEILKKENFIISVDDKLYINKNFFKAPLCSTSVKAGFASILEDKIEKRISLDEMFNLNSPSCFIFKVSGDSMENIGILDGDYVIIKKQNHANLNDVVLANIDNEFTLKTYKKDLKGYYLKPENDNYPILRPQYSLSIFGVAIGITRKL